MKDTILYEVRCPNTKWIGNSGEKHCNMLCGRVNALTVGELHCRKCKINYHFMVNEDGKIDYFYEPTVVKKRYDNKTAEGRLLNLLNED